MLGGDLLLLRCLYNKFTNILFRRESNQLNLFESFIILQYLAMETTQPHHRTWMGVFISIMYAIGAILLAGFAYFVRDWRLVQLLAIVPTAFCALMSIL